MSIQLLPDVLIAQIAAGEVVERPASVVKELVENALDAGAGSVHISVKGGGRTLIRISDDGHGIMAEQVELAFARHATSKINTIDDLQRIMTLGFRGEALSSIASVSRTTITTRHREQQTGTQLRIEGGVVAHQQAIGAPAGTMITVENLFYNTPARLKFLKTENTEKRHITALITRYAMAYPHVRFTLEQEGREAIRTTGSGELSDVIVQVLGLDNFKHLLPVEAENSGPPAVAVHGYTGSAQLHRADRGQITLFVNGRWISDSKLLYAVVQAYQGILRDGRYPVAVLMVEISPDEVDVNVHPTKAEVRFRDANAVFKTIQRGVRSAIIASGQRPDIARSSEVRHANDWGQSSGWREPTRGVSQPEIGLQVQDDGRLPQPYINRNTYSEEEVAVPDGVGQPVRPRTLPPLRVVGQVAATYIIAEGPAGLYLIDQHAAHQRVLYEQLVDADFNMSALPTPQTVELTPTQARLIDAQMDVLNDNGCEIAPFGGHTFQVRAVPEMALTADPHDLLRAIAEDMRQRPPLEAVRLCISGYGAVKAGQTLSQDDMQAIVRRLERAREPLKDPLDRPTLLHMTGDQLARQFGR
ncbi:MAG: DNA mismatch repair endonuclease MutL [Anaerolineaceae bacterium]|nr:MAG: DNA mismatch repair endonuclease MutL [Anaerolineaceae bacterium]